MRPVTGQVLAGILSTSANGQLRETDTRAHARGLARMRRCCRDHGNKETITYLCGSHAPKPGLSRSVQDATSVPTVTVNGCADTAAKFSHCSRHARTHTRTHSRRSLAGSNNGSTGGSDRSSGRPSCGSRRSPPGLEQQPCGLTKPGVMRVRESCHGNEDAHFPRQQPRAAPGLSLPASRCREIRASVM